MASDDAGLPLVHSPQLSLVMSRPSNADLGGLLYGEPGEGADTPLTLVLGVVSGAWAKPLPAARVTMWGRAGIKASALAAARERTARALPVPLGAFGRLQAPRPQRVAVRHATIWTSGCRTVAGDL